MMMMMMMILMRKRRRKKRKREMTRANERISQKSLSSFEKNSSVWSFNQTAHLCEKVGKGRKKKNKKKTGRQKLTSLPATDSRSLQNEKRKLVFVGPPKDDDTTEVCCKKKRRSQRRHFFLRCGCSVVEIILNKYLFTENR